MAFRPTLAARTLALVLASVSSGAAHFGERTDSLWGFVSRSDVIVLARVVDSRTHEERGHTTRAGAVRLHVDELLRGRGPTEVDVLVQGMHQPRYARGEQVLVFAEHSRGTLRSLQSRTEKVGVGGAVDPAVEAVRRYVRIAAVEEPRARLAELKRFTIELLGSPVPRLHQDAVFDLSRPKLLDDALTGGDLAILATLALAEGSPLVVREGIATKVGVLASAGRPAARPVLERLAIEPANPAVRVAALNALRNARIGARAMMRSLEAENAWVRLAAVEGLHTLGERASIPLLEHRLADGEGRVRFAALKAIVAIGGPESEAALSRAREHGTPETRAMIARFASTAQKEIE